MKYSFLNLAEKVLKKTKIPMTANEIWECAIQNKWDRSWKN